MPVSWRRRSDQVRRYLNERPWAFVLLMTGYLAVVAVGDYVLEAHRVRVVLIPAVTLWVVVLWQYWRRRRRVN